MSETRAEFDPPKPENPTQESTVIAPCLRCHQAAVLDDDGFCDACRKVLEEACL